MKRKSERLRKMVLTLEYTLFCLKRELGLMPDIIEGFEIREHLDHRGVEGGKYYIRRANRTYKDFQAKTTQLSYGQAIKTRELLVNRILAARKKKDEQRTHS